MIAILLRGLMLFLIICLGAAVLSTDYTYGLRVVALIALLFLYGTCVAFVFIERQNKITERYRRNLDDIRGLVSEVEANYDRLKGWKT